MQLNDRSSISRDPTNPAASSEAITDARPTAPRFGSFGGEEIRLDGVSKTYPGGVLALEALTLRVAPGELLVLFGPSGCGKTTTLRLLAGLEEPSSGEIFVGVRRMNGVPAHRRDVAMAFQRPALYPHLSVRDNLLFGLRMRGGSPDEARRVAEV